jgi:ADP-heptose:LPS heptosyltransferase
MQKLILKNFLSPGDLVMLTAAVRDLHRCYPGRFQTDVRTSCPEIWEHNPYLTPLSESDREVQVLECAYPLIDRCNEAPYHCLHGFIEFLNQRLELNIKPTLFKGDIHLSAQEKAWYSQVHEVTGRDIPFWIIVAGGKYDVPIKWWDARRFQQVVDHFAGRIQFVQVGEIGHHHPRLDGVIDLRGQTNLREFIRLVYHAQGVLCPVTAAMHLAAAVEVKRGPINRPCVVIAGGREPVHWEAYPDHQFISTNGALACCSNGGCWKARVTPLGDGDERDHPEHLCVNVVGALPRCMDMISAAEVIRRIELYFDGGVLCYLTSIERRAGRRGIKATRWNSYDDQPLTIHNARQALERFIPAIPPYPDRFRGRGIVICGGGLKYFTCAWVCIRMLRKFGCELPIELWHLGESEMDPEMKSLLAPWRVECVDAYEVAKVFPVRRLGGWELKPYAILHSRFQEVLFLDADNVPVKNPEFLFETNAFKKTGALFWPDYGQFEKTRVIWKNCGLVQPDAPEFESGQMVVDKSRCWAALALAMWFNEHSDFYFQHLHGDKETFHLAFEKLKQPYHLISTPIHRLPGTMCQHDLDGRRLFQHRNNNKWNLFLLNARVPGFEYEADCRQCIEELREIWDGRTRRFSDLKFRKAAKRPPVIKACMISCHERDALRAQTLENLKQTDWDDEPVTVQLDFSDASDREERQRQNTFEALRSCLPWACDYILFLEDDLMFNRHLRHNLTGWPLLRERTIALGSLYNPYLSAVACDFRNRAWLMRPEVVFGSQAFLIGKSALKFFLQHWPEVNGLQDIKLSRLAGRLQKVIYYHAPSLVQHVGEQSVWGGGFHQAVDFDPDWKLS